MDMMALRRNVLAASALKEHTVTGNPVAFHTNVAKPLTGFTVPFLPIQTGSGDPSPQNERPIVGWTGVEAGSAGVNLYDENATRESSYYYNSSGVKVTNSDYSTTDYIRIKPSTTYFWAIDGVQLPLSPSHSSPRIAYYDINKNYISSSGTLGLGSSFTTPETAFYIRLPVYKNVTTAMLVEGNSLPSVYIPYAGQSYPVIFPALGKNLLNPALAVAGYYTDKGANHAQSSSNYEYRFEEYVPVDGIETITAGYSAFPSGQTKWVGVCWYNENKGFISRQAGSKAMNTFTVPENAKYVRFSSRTYNQGTQYCFLAYGEQPFELFDNTVYGGTLYPVNGVLTVEWAKVDLGTLQWRFNKDTSVRQSWDAYLSNVKQLNADFTFEGMCESFKSLSYNATWTPFIVAEFQGRVYITFEPSAYANKSEVSEALSGVSLVYPLATPYEIQLDPITVQTLIGDNTIWTDTNGNNTVKYLKRG